MLCENVLSLVFTETLGLDDSLEWEPVLNASNLVENLLHLLACREELLECITLLYRDKVSVITVLCLQVLLVVKHHDGDILLKEANYNRLSTYLKEHYATFGR